MDAIEMAKDFLDNAGDYVDKEEVAKAFARALLAAVEGLEGAWILLANHYATGPARVAIEQIEQTLAELRGEDEH